MADRRTCKEKCDRNKKEEIGGAEQSKGESLMEGLGEFSVEN